MRFVPTYDEEAVYPAWHLEDSHPTLIPNYNIYWIRQEALWVLTRPYRYKVVAFPIGEPHTLGLLGDDMQFEKTEEEDAIYQIVPVDVFPAGKGLLKHHAKYPTLQSVRAALAQDWGKYTVGRWKVLAFPLSSDYRVVNLED